MKVINSRIFLSSYVTEKIILHEIPFQIAQRLEELKIVVQRTLFGIQNSNSEELLREMLEYLTQHGLVNLDGVRLFF